MALLILGLAIWIAAHVFKRAAPGPRERLGDAGRAIVAVGVVAGLVLMIVGYREAAFVNLWFPPAWTVHLNNLLMLVAVFVFGMSATTGRLRGRMRHPMLWSVVIWAVAHLLVNGDLASLVLFGGLGLWALAEMAIINRAEPVWDRPAPGAAKKDIVLVVITLVAFAVMSGVHVWLGVWPFPG